MHGSSHSLDRRQTLALEVARLRPARRDIRSSVNELLQRHVAITALPIEVAIFIGRVFHIEGVVLRLAMTPFGRGSLGHSRRACRCRPRRRCTLGAPGQLTLAGHVVESLLRVHAGLERGRPRSGVDRRSALLLVVNILPIHEERDSVLGLRVAADGRGDTSRGRGRDLDGLVSALDHPAVDLA